jgi:hypothetical protein
LNTLLDWGAKPDSPRGGKTPIMLAAGYTKSAACVTSLIQHGADVHAVDTSGLNALMWGCINFQSHFAHLQPLLKVCELERADINGRSALFRAASTHLTPTQALIRAGANLDHSDRNGFTALHMAISYHHSNILRALILAQANYMGTTSNGQTLLHHAALYADITTINTMFFCKLEGMDTLALDAEGCTPRERLNLRIPQATEEVVLAFENLLAHIHRLATTALIHGTSGTVSPTSTVESAVWLSASEYGGTGSLTASGNVSDDGSGFESDVDGEAGPAVRALPDTDVEDFATGSKG